MVPSAFRNQAIYISFQQCARRPIETAASIGHVPGEPTVFCKAQDDFERLLAIFAEKLIAGHDDLRITPETMEL
jgi:hypothetical protein